MNEDPFTVEVERNYDFFQRNLASYLAEHRDAYALIKAQRLVAFFDKPGAAYQAGIDRFGDTPFSIQEVTDEPIDLGFFSRVGR